MKIPSFFRFINSLFLLIFLLSPSVFAAPDVHEGDWYYTYVDELEDQGVLDPDQDFNPGEEAPRYYVVLLLAKAYFGDDFLGTTSTFDFGFTDLEGIPDEYESEAIDAINYFAQHGIISGDTDSGTGALLYTFRPTEAVNRAEISKILTGALALDPSFSSDLLYYADVPLTDDLGALTWFHSYVNTGTEWGLFTGDTDSDGTPLGIFRPNSPIVKAEVAALAVRGTEASYVGPLSIVADLDSDSDGLSNAEEMLAYFSNPTLADSDLDGYSDGEEVEANTDPLDEADFPVGKMVYEFIIQAQDFEFTESENIEVPAGAHVIINFENLDEGVSHSLSFDNDDIESTSISEGISLEVLDFTAPETPGEYEYHCDVHPSMTGSITVTD